MADGLFVAGSTDGWLLWNTNNDMQTPDPTVQLVSDDSLAAFDRTDQGRAGREASIAQLRIELRLEGWRGSRHGLMGGIPDQDCTRLQRPLPLSSSRYRLAYQHPCAVNCNCPNRQSLSPHGALEKPSLGVNSPLNKVQVLDDAG